LILVWEYTNIYGVKSQKTVDLKGRGFIITHKVYCHHRHYYNHHHHHHHYYHLHISIFRRTWNIRYTAKYWLRTKINSLLCTVDRITLNKDYIYKKKLFVSGKRFYDFTILSQYSRVFFFFFFFFLKRYCYL
jgi:hypothetical protein